MLPASRILPLLLLTPLLPTACARQRIPRHTTLSQDSFRHELRRESDQDQRSVKARVAPDGVVTFHTQWRPACLVQDVDRKVVRTRMEPDLPAGAWLRDSAFVLLGGWFIHRALTTDREPGDAGFIGLMELGAGTAFVVSGAVLFSLDAAHVLARPPEETRTVLSTKGNPRVDVCDETQRLRTLTVLLPNATLSAPIDEEGTARVAIPPHVWEGADDGLDADVRIGPYELGRVRLRLEAAGEQPREPLEHGDR